MFIVLSQWNFRLCVYDRWIGDLAHLIQYYSGCLCETEVFIYLALSNQSCSTSRTDKHVFVLSNIIIIIIVGVFVGFLKFIIKVFFRN